MSTQCKTNQLEFLPFKNPRTSITLKVTSRFDADKVSSDGGIALLRETEHRFRVIRSFSECFLDHRNPSYVTHSVFSMVAQRVLGLCCGYEDVNDHDRFRMDPLASMFCDRYSPLAGKSTINRMELRTEKESRYKKVEADFYAIDRLLVELFLRFHKQNPKILCEDSLREDVLREGGDGEPHQGPAA